MSWRYDYPEGVLRLRNDRVSEDDADRQERTAREILRRLESQPGVILADEVGMGKTFVALAVAAAVCLRSKRRDPIVVMVPAALKDKWPNDFEVFKARCLDPGAAARLTAASAADGVSFFKLLDDPPERRTSIIFLSHGALTRGLQDPWVKLALIQAAFYHRKSLTQVREAFPKFAAELVWLKSWSRKVTPEVIRRLMGTDPRHWRGLLARAGVELEDDPVPEALLNKVRDTNRQAIADVLRDMPRRATDGASARISAVQKELARVLRDEVWPDWLSHTDARSPLLILDEAHHFKNPHTRFASLFQDKEAQQDADALRDGALNKVFERMLFLTATPFQLGHGELVEVLKRFSAIRWSAATAPERGREAFAADLDALMVGLNDARLAAIRLQELWGRLTPAHLPQNGGAAPDVEAWWRDLPGRSDRTALEDDILRQHAATAGAAQRAGKLLRPWVIRHGRGKALPTGGVRRERLDGAAIATDQPACGVAGLELDTQALLPFLIAARAAVITEAQARRDGNGTRALFADGLASSYESYLKTRRNKRDLDLDADLGADGSRAGEDPGRDRRTSWYLEQLDRVIPSENATALAQHPKVRRTVQRAIELWARGEKVLIFCHYIATGMALRNHISRAMDEQLVARAKELLGTGSESDVRRRLDRLGDEFFKSDELGDIAASALQSIVYGTKTPLGPDDQGKVVGVVRRFVRTPSFLVRYYPIDEQNRAAAFDAALDKPDLSGHSLRDQVARFCWFLGERCTRTEREGYLDALEHIQTGAIYGREAVESMDPDESSETERLLPNVRFVHGATKDDSRRRLMKAFNTPFFPEILIASSVLAEGVDLHLNCRHVIHHDLDWNPSTLEQRTGRVDRLGCKAERAGRPIRVYQPYVAGTQDERQFRVVRDRERWFAVVMGERFEMNEAGVASRAERIELPDHAASQLAMDLCVSISEH